MNKKIVNLVIFVCLFCVASFALAQQITDPLGGTTFPQLLTRIANKVGEFIAGLSVIMLIVAGIFYLTSAGSPERVGVAKKTLLYAIVGMVIGIAASAIATAVCGVLGTTC